MLIRSHATGAKTVPAVSIVICSPRSRSRWLNGRISGAIIGSPPVTTTCRAGCARTSSRIWSRLRSTPSGLQENDWPRAGRLQPWGWPATAAALTCRCPASTARGLGIKAGEEQSGGSQSYLEIRPQPPGWPQGPEGMGHPHRDRRGAHRMDHPLSGGSHRLGCKDDRVQDQGWHPRPGQTPTTAPACPRVLAARTRGPEAMGRHRAGQPPSRSQANRYSACITPRSSANKHSASRTPRPRTPPCVPP